MSVPSKVEFGELKIGQRFSAYGCIYKKKDERRATVILDASGEKPSSEAIHRFYPEVLVTLRSESE